MKKYFVIFALAFMAIGCSKQVTQVDDNSNVPTPSINSNQGEQSGPTQTYRNSTFNFEFQYPNDLTFSNPTYGNLQQQIVQVGFGKAEYPGTNFGDAAVTISNENAVSLQKCLTTNLPGGIAALKDTVQINGATFYKGEGSDAGAGNLYNSRIYRTFRSSNCYEIAETLHTSNIGNYEPGTVKEVDHDTVWARLEKITATFKFN